MKFRVELWRVVKFILITAAVNLPLALANSALVSLAAAGGVSAAKTWLPVLTYAQVILSAVILTPLHRYFTFRATEKWYIAVPLMLAAAIAWQLLKAFPMMAAAKSSQEALLTISDWLSILWLGLQYLLQRCVIYCHTADQNGWYRRFHTDEKGE